MHWWIESVIYVVSKTTLKGSIMAEDMINHPSHYTNGPIECYEITKYLDFTTGNMVKYLYRWKLKHTPKTDLSKALWYANHMNRVNTRYTIEHNPKIQEGLRLLEDNNWMELGHIWKELREGHFDQMVIYLEMFVCLVHKYYQDE